MKQKEKKKKKLLYLFLSICRSRLLLIDLFLLVAFLRGGDSFTIVCSTANTCVADGDPCCSVLISNQFVDLTYDTTDDTFFMMTGTTLYRYDGGVQLKAIASAAPTASLTRVLPILRNPSSLYISTASLIYSFGKSTAAFLVVCGGGSTVMSDTTNVLGTRASLTLPDGMSNVRGRLYFVDKSSLFVYSELTGVIHALLFQGITPYASALAVLHNTAYVGMNSDVATSFLTINLLHGSSNGGAVPYAPSIGASSLRSITVDCKRNVLYFVFSTAWNVSAYDVKTQRTNTSVFDFPSNFSPQAGAFDPRADRIHVVTLKTFDFTSIPLGVGAFPASTRQGCLPTVSKSQTVQENEVNDIHTRTQSVKDVPQTESKRTNSVENAEHVITRTMTTHPRKKKHKTKSVSLATTNATQPAAEATSTRSIKSNTLQWKHVGDTKSRTNSWTQVVKQALIVANTTSISVVLPQLQEAMSSTAVVATVLTANAATLSALQTTVVVGSLSCLDDSVRTSTSSLSWVISPMSNVHHFDGLFEAANMVIWNVVLLTMLAVVHVLVLGVVGWATDTRSSAGIQWPVAMYYTLFPSITFLAVTAFLQGTSVVSFQSVVDGDSAGAVVIGLIGVVLFPIGIPVVFYYVVFYKQHTTWEPYDTRSTPPYLRLFMPRGVWTPPEETLRYGFGNDDMIPGCVEFPLYVYGYYIVLSVAASLPVGPALCYVQLTMCTLASVVLAVAYVWWRPNRSQVVSLLRAVSAVSQAVVPAMTLLAGPKAEWGARASSGAKIGQLAAITFEAIVLIVTLVWERYMIRKWRTHGMDAATIEKELTELIALNPDAVSTGDGANLRSESSVMKTGMYQRTSEADCPQSPQNVKRREGLMERIGGTTTHEDEGLMERIGGTTTHEDDKGDSPEHLSAEISSPPLPMSPKKIISRHTMIDMQFDAESTLRRRQDRRRNTAYSKQHDDHLDMSL